MDVGGSGRDTIKVLVLEGIRIAARNLMTNGRAPIPELLPNAKNKS
jgi:hypothetical protein